MMKSIVFLAAFLGAIAPALAAPVIRPMPNDTAIRSAGNRMTAALNLLEARGYGDFSGFKSAGADYVATVRQAGHAFEVRIDPIAQTVSRIG